MKKIMKCIVSMLLALCTVFGLVAVIAPTPVSAAESSSNGVMVFSKKKDGNTYLSKNFQVKEFACNDGSDTILIDPELVVILQKIRDHFGAVTINSAYRTASYNKKIHGATNSNHVKGMAADIRISGVAPKEIAVFAESLGVLGIGLYETPSDGYFVHIDTRSTKKYWYGQAQKRRTTFGGDFNAKPYSGTTLFNVSAPSSVKSGQPFAFSGSAISTSNIISCEGELIEIDGKVRRWFTFLPQGKFCSVTHTADISPGVYTFRITAKTAEGNESWEQLLVVSGNMKTKGLTLDGKIASSFKEGKTPTASGGISTALFKKVKRVQIVILDNNGNVVQSTSYKPNARTVKLQTLVKNIRLNKLDCGAYTLVIAAYDSAGRIACSTQSFKVK